MFENRPHLASASSHVTAQTWASQQLRVSPLSMQELCNCVHAQEPCMRTNQGAVMIADITGFTALTEDLGRRGASGVELLTRCMNNYFTLVIELVRLFFFLSGVLHFAGPECQKPINAQAQFVRCHVHRSCSADLLDIMRSMCRSIRMAGM